MAGKLVHFELSAGDTERARKFYGDLFGWQYESYPGPFEYHMTRTGDDQGGAIQPASDDGVGILVYFDVDDIRAATERVRELGGEAQDPQPVPQMGWFAPCKDSEGIRIGLWQNDPSAPTPEGM
jgi:predicted enzyme related to lactoylglutathione lyase